MSLTVLIVLIGVCLLFEAFFSASEIAFVSSSKAKIFRRAKEKNREAALAKNLLSRPETLFSTTILGTTLAINTATTLATLYIIRTLGYQKEWVTLAVLTPIILIFVEFVPKMFARTYADEVATRMARPILIASLVLYPLTKLLSLYAQLLRRVVGESPDKGFFLSREEIKGALPASRGSDVTASERQLIERIFDFGQRTVKEKVRPLIDVVAIEQDLDLREAIRLLADSGHSRLPVYHHRIDHIVGVVQGADCLRADQLDAAVKDVMQPPFFVPESKPLDELLRDLKTRPMAIAVNEYGGAEGIITMEDVIEEIVGEIEDEYDEPPKLFHQIGDNSYIVNARIEVEDLAEQLGISLPKDDDYQTLGGFLLKRMQKIPKKWDSTVIDGVEYVVQSATDRSIEEVYIIQHAPKS